jgi:Na+-driven multidrug efflux pump
MVYSFLVSATVVLDSAMRSAGKVKTATVASVTAVFVSFSIGIPAAIAFGVRGAVYGLVASQFSTLCVLLVAYIRMQTSTAPTKLVSSVSLCGLSESPMPRRIYNDA